MPGQARRIRGAFAEWITFSTSATATSASTAYAFSFPLSWSNALIENYPEETPQARLDREMRANAAAIERARAIERATLLLVESLSGAQLESYKGNGWFEVATVDKRGVPRIFRIHRGCIANIFEMSIRGDYIARWCVHPGLDVPDEDTMLAQKLWLETNPDGLLSQANRHPL